MANTALNLTDNEKELLEHEKNLDVSFGPPSEDMISSNEIRFYINESDVLKTKEHFKFLKNDVFDFVSADSTILNAPFGDFDDRIDWDLGSELYNIALTRLEDFSEIHLPESQKTKMDLLEYVSEKLSPNDYEEINALWSYFSEEGLKDNFMGLGSGDLPQVSERTLDEYWGDIGDDFWVGDEVLTKGFALDIVKSLQAQALNKEDTESYARKCKEFERFFSRASSAMKGRVGEIHDYVVAPIVTSEGMKCAARNVEGSCLFNDPEEYGYESDREMFDDHPFEEAFRMWYEDPGTMYHAIGKNGNLEGYTRTFLLEDSEGNYFGGLDTIEVDKSGGLQIEDIEEDFSEKSDVLCAGVLGVAAHLFTLGADYLVGKDARVRFGPRQMFGNTKKPIEYTKVGHTVPYYSVYKGDDWAGAGWLGYHQKGEAEIRGFKTEPGTHSTENAYLLMKNPNTLPTY